MPTGPSDSQLVVPAVSALFTRIGPGILVTHSRSGQFGWRAAAANANVRAVVSLEPGGDFIFPQGEAPTVSLRGNDFKPPEVPLADFMALTKIPIVIYYGDNIPATTTTTPGPEQWRVFLQLARLFRDAVNARGGDVTVVHLPEIGIRGNTHFPMSDLNNVQLADHLAQKGLER